MGPITDNLTSMPYPGLKPGIFSAAAGFPNFCTARSALLFEDAKYLNNSIVFNILKYYLIKAFIFFETSLRTLTTLDSKKFSCLHSCLFVSDVIAVIRFEIIRLA